MDASVSDFLIYSTDGWIPGTLSTSNMIDLNANHLSLVTHNVSNNDVMFFDGSEWTHGSFFQSSIQLIMIMDYFIYRLKMR